MNITAVIGFCIISAIVLKAAEKDSIEIKTAAVFAAVMIIFGKTIESISSLIGEIKYIFNQAQVDEQYLKILFKGVGICYITRLASDFCKDCSENSLASQVQLAGRIALLIVSMPLFNAFVDVIKTLLN